MRAKTVAINIGKNVLGVAIVGAVLVGLVVAGVAINVATKAKSASQVSTNRTVNDGTTHDMTIVWPEGTEQVVSYNEVITPRRSTYTGPKNTHKSSIKMVSFNPLDSANKAGQGITPSTFAEGDRPSIQLNEVGVNTSKASGAELAGMSGSNPVLGEYIGWIGLVVIGLIGLVVIIGIGKWMWSVWKTVEPAVVGAATAAIGLPLAAPVAAGAVVAANAEPMVPVVLAAPAPAPAPPDAAYN